MNTTTRCLALALLGLALTGCGAVFYLPCDPTAKTGSPTCRAILTDNPADEQAWTFEARPQVYISGGIPVGRVPTDVLVVGDREACEARRAQARETAGWWRWLAYTSTAVLTYSGDGAPVPTEPCKGPVFFRRTAPAEPGSQPADQPGR